jgi:hypothetical protein
VTRTELADRLYRAEMRERDLRRRLEDATARAARGELALSTHDSLIRKLEARDATCARLVALLSRAVAQLPAGELAADVRLELRMTPTTSTTATTTTGATAPTTQEG